METANRITLIRFLQERKHGKMHAINSDISNEASYFEAVKSFAENPDTEKAGNRKDFQIFYMEAMRSAKLDPVLDRL